MIIMQTSTKTCRYAIEDFVSETWKHSQMLDKAFRMRCLRQTGQLLLSVPLSLIPAWHLLLESTASATTGVTYRTGAAAGTGRGESTQHSLGWLLSSPGRGDTGGSVQIPGAVALTTHLAPFSTDYMVSDVGKVCQSDARWKEKGMLRWFQMATFLITSRFF